MNQARDYALMELQPMMAEPLTSWFIATVWVTNRDGEAWTQHVLRLQACDEDDYRGRARKMFAGARAVEFGPVSLSKVQQ